MTNEKLYIIAKKLVSFFPSGENMETFLERFKYLYTKQNEFFSLLMKKVFSNYLFSFIS